MLGVSLGVLRASPPSSRASSPPSAALATLAMTESAASGLDRSRLWCARNVAASRRNDDSAPSLQRCRGAEVQRCNSATVQWCNSAVVQWCRGLSERRLTAPHSARRTWPTHRVGSRTPDGRECGGIRHLGSQPRRSRGATWVIPSCQGGALESAWGLGSSSRLAGTPTRARRVRHMRRAAQAVAAARSQRRTP